MESITSDIPLTFKNTMDQEQFIFKKALEEILIPTEMEDYSEKDQEVLSMFCDHLQTFKKTIKNDYLGEITFLT